MERKNRTGSTPAAEKKRKSESEESCLRANSRMVVDIILGQEEERRRIAKSLKEQPSNVDLILNNLSDTSQEPS